MCALDARTAIFDLWRLVVGCLCGLAGVRNKQTEGAQYTLQPLLLVLMAFVSCQSAAVNCCQLWTLPVRQKKGVVGYPNGIFPPYNPPICLYLPSFVCLCCPTGHISALRLVLQAYCQRTLASEWLVDGIIHPLNFVSRKVCKKC